MTTTVEANGAVREFRIHAVEAEIVMNAFGLHVHEGAMYVLHEDVEDVQAIRAAITTYEAAIGDLFETIEERIDSHGGIEGLERAVLDDIPDELSDSQLDGVERFREDVEEAYEHAIEGVTETIERGEDDGGYETDAEFRAAVDEAAAEYRGSVPPELNPLDDGFALVEGEPKSPSVLQPLVVRANAGETIEITLENHLDRHASIHQTSLPYDVETSDGMAVGRNPDTTVPPGEKRSYRWEAAHTGTQFFYDGANQAFDSTPKRSAEATGDERENERPKEEANLFARGLFGAVVVEPEGAEWYDPETGVDPEADDYRSGVRAVVDDPEVGTCYREFVVFYHSPVGVEPRVTWPGTDKNQSQHAINYRCDPTGQRVHDGERDVAGSRDVDCVDCDSEKFFYHSWTNGDPGGGDNAYTAYRGEPVKFCFVGASHEENHVHHLHQHRTKEMPRADAATVDAQTIGLGDTYEAYLVAGHGPGSVRPDTSFEAAFEDAGAGYVHGTAGDILFHCHLFPHYAEGMWGTMRVLDKERGFLEPLPGTEVVGGAASLDPDELPLPPEAILDEESDAPGFPAFVGEAIEAEEGVLDPRGHAAPRPPGLAVGDGREATPLERAVLSEDAPPGAPYADPAPPYETEVAPYEDAAAEAYDRPRRILTYTITVTETEIAYNDAGEFDPEGVAYVLDDVEIEPGPGRSEEEVVTMDTEQGAHGTEDSERVRAGEMNPEPLFLRANVGDLVRVRLHNDLDLVRAGGQTEEWDASIHPHYVGYDVLSSDSLPNGYNYYQASEPDGTIESRWYADEQGTIYFHDHIFAIKEGVHGMFCGLVVEPTGAEWRDPYSGKPVYSGAQADIVPADEGGSCGPGRLAGFEPFREQAIHYHDFAPLREPTGEFVNPEREHTIVNKGTMAINYRNAPYYTRDGSPGPGGVDDSDADDAAYVHSSAVHGDPPTPVLEAYDGDPIRFRVFQGAYEEQHTFSVHGLRTRRDPDLVEESVSKYLGTSEAFTFEITGQNTTREGFEVDNPDDLPVRDHRYGSNVIDDLWTGMWGLVRLWGGEVDHLEPLGDADPPAETVDPGDLREMGHPAPHSSVDWTEEGQRAKHLYAVEDAAALRTGEESDRDELPPPLDRTERLPDSAHVEEIARNRRREGPFRTVVVPADVAARRNDHVGDVPPRPDAASVTRGDTPVREYEVTALETEIPYNDHGDHDPYGVVFALDQYAGEVARGVRDPEPPVFRVNEGERLRVTLTNDLGAVDNDHPDPEMLVREGRAWERSDRVSLHPLALQYDVNASDGAAVGFNYDTTVGPGESYTYEWRAADDEVTTVCLWDMADVRSTRHHGAFGQVAVEPAGAVPLDPATAEPAVAGGSALVRQGSEDFREHCLLFADAQYVVGDDGADGNTHDEGCVVPREDAGGDGGGHGHGGETDRPPCTQIPEDTEDQGYGGVNHRSEPFDRRFETTRAQHLVYDSGTHGDPATPVVEAAAGDPVRFRVGCAGDKARAITFHLAGHQWDRFRDEDESPVVGVDGQFGPGTAMTLEPKGGAGGPGRHAGDYVYQETKQRRRLESGLWGIFRVHDTEDTRESEETETTESRPVPLQPLPDRAADVPLAERPGYDVESGTDLTGSGATDVVVGVQDSNLGAAGGGAVYVFTGDSADVDPDGIEHLAGADLQVVGTGAGEHAGSTVDGRERSGDDGCDIVVGTSSGETIIPGGSELRELIDRVERGDGPTSGVTTLVRGAMPGEDHPVVSLSSVSDGN